jgi:nitronate monooxygenase
MTSSLLQRLGIALPIIQGPMTGSDTPPWPQPCRAAGCMLGCGMRSHAASEAAAAVRQQTDRPFGMNLFVQPRPPRRGHRASGDGTPGAAVRRAGPAAPAPTQWCEDFAAQFEALLALRPAVASFTSASVPPGAPARRWLGGGHSHHGGRVARRGRGLMRCVPAAPKPGHRGTSWRFHGSAGRHPGAGAAVRGRRQHPGDAAGGIMDGRGIAAPRRWARRRCRWARPSGVPGIRHRPRVPAGPGPGPRHRHAAHPHFGRPARGIVNAMMEALAAEEDRARLPRAKRADRRLRRTAATQGRTSHLSLWAGQGVGAARPQRG